MVPPVGCSSSVGLEGKIDHEAGQVQLSGVRRHQSRVFWQAFFFLVGKTIAAMRGTIPCALDG